MCFHCDGNVEVSVQIRRCLSIWAAVGHWVSCRQPGDHGNKTSEISSYPPGSCSCCCPQLVGRAVRATADSGCHLLLSSLPEPSGFVTLLLFESSHETIWEHLAPSTTTQELREHIEHPLLQWRTDSHCSGDKPLTPPLSVNPVRSISWSRAAP